MSMCQSFSSILLACCAVIHCVIAQSNRASTVYIVPASDSESPPTSSCPGDPCLTIDQYVSNSSLRNGITDISLELQPGYHNLSVPFNIRSSVLSIALTGTGRGATLLCTEEFTFSFISSVRISGINLVNCGGVSTHIMSIQNFTLEDSTFTSDMPFRLRTVTGDFVISNSVFSNCTSGALLITFGQPVIRNCTFSNNVKRRMPLVPGDTNGGVINFVSVNDALIDQCTFTNNRAMFTSGALYFTDGTSFIRNSYFSNNSALEWDGGAIYSIGGSLFIGDSSFTNNVAGDNGGAVYFAGEANTFIISRSEFLNNAAGFEGGAVSIAHRNFDLSLLLQARIDNSRFAGNSASRGGAVFERGGNISLNILQNSFVNNTCNHREFGSGALYIISGKSETVIRLTTFTNNSGADGAVGVIGSNYFVTVQNSAFTDNVATVSGGAIVSTSLNVGNFTIQDSAFYRNSAPQCGAVDLKSDDMNPNVQNQNGLEVKVLDSLFVNNSASVGRGGALCASAISVSISGLVSSFRRNSAVTGGGAISTTNSALTITGASFSDNSARSGGDAIHACSSEVTVESSDGRLQSSSNTDGQCLTFNNNITITLPINGGVSSYAVNLPLFSFMMILFMLANMLLC